MIPYQTYTTFKKQARIRCKKDVLRNFATFT